MFLTPPNVELDFRRTLVLLRGVPDVRPETAERDEKYRDEVEDLMTALHEVIGHGSGKLSDQLKGGAEPWRLTGHAGPGRG